MKNWNALSSLPAVTLSAALTVALSGCASMNSGRPQGNQILPRPAAVSVDDAADWAWTVAGDGAIRPLQVFAINGKTYLQMRASQIMPAVLVQGLPITFAVKSPYIVLDGTPSHIDLLASGYRAVIEHVGALAIPMVAPTPLPPRDRVQRIYNNGGPATRTYPSTESTIDITRTPLSSAPLPVPQDVIRPLAVLAPVWRISPEQRLLSQALDDWSRLAGIHLVWNSRVDVPITGPAEYRDTDFLLAMSHALADASSDGYRFYFSMTGAQTVTVVAIRAS